MLDENLKTELKGLRFEIIDLNQSSYFFVRKMSRMGYVFQNTSREYWLEELTALRYLENGIILHLTNLDDKSSVYSFREAQNVLNQTKLPIDQKLLRKLKKKLDAYRKSINHLKTKHRNSRIAHISSTEFPSLDQFFKFDQYLKPLILEANAIGDLIWGEKITAEFKLGSYEGILDFKALSETLSVDLNKNQEFR